MFVDIGYGLLVRADLVESIWQPAEEEQVETLQLSGWRGRSRPCAVVQTIHGARYGSPFSPKTVLHRVMYSRSTGRPLAAILEENAQSRKNKRRSAL